MERVDKIVASRLAVSRTGSAPPTVLVMERGLAERRFRAFVL